MKSIDSPRRRFLGATGLGALASLFGGALSVLSKSTHARNNPMIRWGFVGTGSIANRMAYVVKDAGSSELVAVSSRKMQTARDFADKHSIENAFDSWADMIAWDGVDAIYVATPTSVREEICVAAANSGKHVLGEKPFASLPSLKRITSACRENGVGFMDGTHFVHHPRTADVRAKMQDRVGWPWSVDSAFQFNLQNRGNIRFNPDLEPLGAIGDAGWYNMRAAVEYISPGVSIRSVSAYLRRDEETGAAISGSGVILFSDGSTKTWNCGFDSGAVVMDLRISGAKGVIRMDDFLSQNQDGSASFTYRGGTVDIASSRPGAVLMFEDFAAMVSDPNMREQSIRSSEQTQLLLDAVWEKALQNERSS
jgi:predicted dehydrogenase